MAAHRIEIEPDDIAKAKYLYEETATSQREIAIGLGMSRDTLSDRATEWGWKRRPRPQRGRALLDAVHATATAAATVEAAPPALLPSGPVTPEQRAAIAQRIQKVVEREMSAVERILDGNGASAAGEPETSARTLAGIARTLREIALLIRPDETPPPNEADDDPIPRDIDEFRRELARRINAFADARQSQQDGDGGFPDHAERPLGP